MATFLRTTVSKNIGTTPVNVLTPALTSSYTVIGCNLSNITDYDVIVSITITDASSNVGSYVNSLTIRPYNSAKIITNGEKLILAGNCIMTIVSDTTAGIDAVISYAEVI
jgi:hypothetical protein